MTRKTRIATLGLVFGALTAAAVAQSNIDNTFPNKFAWGENVGWTNWRDANGAAQGVHVGGLVLAGFIWAENVGWMNVGDGTPGGAGGQYANTDGSDAGVNISPDGTLHGYAWGENVGWINFDGGALATTAQPARIECDGRLNGYAWAENLGWINLSTPAPGKYVAVDAATTPIVCDMNHDGLPNGPDIQAFINRLLLGGYNWRDVCSGDVEAVPDGMIDPGDIVNFVACLLS